MAADASETVTPETISNRPALSAIQYRVGTYGSFRRSMLEQIARWERDADAAGEPDIRPLQGWTTRASDDFGIAFLEMWAYLGDILTFYQERIANEAFLRTAVQEESTAFLVSLIGYRPSPGKAAAAYLAFEAEKNATVRLDSGLLVQSVPGQDEKPQKFETIETIAAYASLNEIRPRTLQDQTLSRGATRAVLDGLKHRIAPGDWIVIAGDERRSDPGSERWDLRRVATAVEDKDEQTTTVTWAEGLGQSARPWRGPIDPDPSPEFWVFRGTAWPFGYNAPDYNLFTISTPVVAAAFRTAYPNNWNDKYLPENGDNPEHLYLDTVYSDIVVGGWVGLVTSRIDATEHSNLAGYEQYIELYPVQSVADTTRQNYTLTGKSTRVTLDKMTTGDDAGQPEHIGYFPLKGTVALVQSEQIALAEVPLGFSGNPAGDVLTPVEGTSIELDALYTDLTRGRTLLVTGTLLDADGNSLGAGSETVTVSLIEGTDRTTIRFASAMSGRYDRSSVVIYGNVANATHGETVAAEKLGDGDASAEFQSFTLKKSPVTFVPSAGVPGGAANTLQVRVDGVKWKETAELYGQDGDARVFVTRRDVDQAMLVQFGDGETGARLVSGRNNVEATYRIGTGPDGNVRAETLRTLLKKPLGLKAVTNPAAAAGGAESEDPAEVKETAPGTVRTFGRIVSLRDFEDAAREFIGVAKARASFVWDGEGRVVRLIIAGDDGALIDVASSGLRADLDARRDPHQPLTIQNYERRNVVVKLSIVVDDAYELDSVSTDADTALRAIFDFDAIRLGQTIHLSDVYLAVQSVDGVAAVDVDEFRFPDQDEGTSEARLLIAPGELAWIDASADLEVTSARFESEETS